MYIEKVNPTHIGIIWGKRHKKQHKGTHYVKCGMVYFSWIPIVMGVSILGWLDVATGFFYNGLINIGILGFMTGIIVSLLFYLIPIYVKEGKRWTRKSLVS